MMMQSGIRNSVVPDPVREQIVHDVDADVLVGQERPGRAQQEDGAEQVPLQLEPGIRAGVEELANDGICRRYGDGGEDKPCDPAADEPVDRVDDPRQAEQD
jgi:hypothetical protein